MSETRNILDHSGTVIGTLTLDNGTSEAIWTSLLSPYANIPMSSIPIQSLSSTTVTGTGPVTTSSATPLTVSGMILTPAAGSYIALFNGGIYTGGASASGEFGFYISDVLIPETRRDISCNLTLLGGLVTVSLNNIGVGTNTGTEVILNGSQTIDVKFKSNNGGTIGFNERVMTLLRIK